MQIFKTILTMCFIAGLYSPAIAHSIHYQVENKGISARVFYSPDDPASYSQYEIFGPGDKTPHQKGRTDKNGFVSFLPDREGTWIIKVLGESDHGYHGAQIEVSVNESLFMESFKNHWLQPTQQLLSASGSWDGYLECGLCLKEIKSMSVNFCLTGTLAFCFYE